MGREESPTLCHADLEEDARCIRWSRAEGVSRTHEDTQENGADEDADTSSTEMDEDDVSDDNEAKEVHYSTVQVYSTVLQLAIISGGEYVYMWRRSGGAAVRVRPAHKWRGEFCARKVEWAHANKGLIVADGVPAKAILAVYPVCRDR